MPTAQQQLREKALSLSPIERLGLAQDLWDSLDQDQASLPLSDEHARVIDDRLASHAADPSAVVTWEQARKEMREEVARHIQEGRE